MTAGATVFVGMATMSILVVAMVVARLRVADPTLRRLLYVIMDTALLLLIAGIGLGWQPVVEPPPLGFAVMMAVAIAASIAILWVAGANGWLRSLPGRAGAAAAIYMVLLIAYPPPLGPGWQVAALFAGIGAALMVAVVGGWRVSGQAATVYAADISFEEDDDDDWTLEEVDDGTAVAVVHGVAAVVVHEPLREGRGGSAGEDGTGALRLSGSAGGSAGDGAGSSGPGGRPDGDGGQQRTDSDGGRAGGDQAPDGMVVYPAVAGVDRNPRSRGRGRRLAGALVQRSGASGHGADAGGGYDAATATAVASLASTGAASGG